MAVLLAWGTIISVACYKLLKSQAPDLTNLETQDQNQNQCRPRDCKLDIHPITRAGRCEQVYSVMLADIALALPNVMCAIIAEYTTESSLAFVKDPNRGNPTVMVLENTGEVMEKFLTGENALHTVPQQWRQIDIKPELWHACLGWSITPDRTTIWTIGMNVDDIRERLLCINNDDLEVLAQFDNEHPPRRRRTLQWPLYQQGFTMKFFTTFCDRWGIMLCHYHRKHRLYVLHLDRAAALSEIELKEPSAITCGLLNDMSGCWQQITSNIVWKNLECRSINDTPHIFLYITTNSGYTFNEEQFQMLVNDDVWQPLQSNMADPRVDPIFGHSSGICVYKDRKVVREYYNDLEAKKTGPRRALNGFDGLARIAVSNISDIEIINDQHVRSFYI